jgi:hypothetical protein
MEKAVLEKLLEGDLLELALLRAQLQSARVQRRDWTGAGFWTNCDVDPASPRLTKRALSGGGRVRETP